MIIEIEALDTLFFRDGKPFNMGDDVWATGMFPPMPSVIYGALRSAYLGQNDIDLDEIEEATSGLRIKKIWYKVTAINEKKKKKSFMYLPLPLDLVHPKELDRKQKRRAEKYHIYDIEKLSISSNEFVSEAKAQGETIASSLAINKDVDNISDGILQHTKYEDYLKGGESFEARKINNHFQSEAKIGIARNNVTKTASEGNLYRVGMLRTSNIKILVELDGLSLKPKGLLRLGGENKLAKYNEKSDDSDDIQLSLQELQLGDLDTFKLCLITPAIFEHGIVPAKIFEKANVEVELITCAVGKSISAGGFNMKKTKNAERGPKIMYKAAPAGSVYYYKLVSGSLKNLEDAIKQHTVSDFRGNEGFGLALIGKI